MLGRNIKLATRLTFVLFMFYSSESFLCCRGMGVAFGSSAYLAEVSVMTGLAIETFIVLPLGVALFAWVVVLVKERQARRAASDR